MAINPIKGLYELSLDRTNWQFRGVNFNILCLTVVAEGVSLPLLWTMLDKRGNSNQDERKILIDTYIRLFGLQTIAFFIADREFIGQQCGAARADSLFINTAYQILCQNTGKSYGTS